MFELTIYNYTTLMLDIGTIVMIAGLMMVTNVLRKSGRDEDKLFFYLLIVNILIAATDIIGYLAAEQSFYGARWVQMYGMELFYLLFILESLIWIHYTRMRFSGKNWSRKNRGYLYYPGIILMALIFINYFTGWIFSVDVNNEYHRGFLFIPMYVVYFINFTYGFVTMIRYRSTKGKKRLIPMWIYFMPIVLGMVITFVLGGSSLAAVGTAITIMFTHLGSMNEISDADFEESKI